MVSVVTYSRGTVRHTLGKFPDPREVYSNCVVSVWWLQVVETMYSNHVLADTHFTYGLADGSAVVARRLYQERYPERRCPDRKTFTSIHPIDFYLWGHLKSLVYSSPVDDVETLRNRIWKVFRQYATCQEFVIVFGMQWDVELRPVFRQEVDIWNI
jgi:hypothetical protein